MQFCKKNWSVFIFGGIVTFVCFIVILAKGEVYLWQSAFQAISSGNLTPDREGVIIGAYGVHSTVAYGLLGVSIALISIGMAFYSQLSLENQMVKTITILKKLKLRRHVWVSHARKKKF
jgi:hypothetical protein